MRLGPVPVAYHLVPAQALEAVSDDRCELPNTKHGTCEVAGWQSLATHPGAEAMSWQSCGSRSEETGFGLSALWMHDDAKPS